MSNLYDLFGNMENIEDIKKYAEAQFSVITNLNKQIEQLKNEKKHLEELLKQSSLPSVSEKTSDEAEEITICKVQLKLLNGISKDRELTIEECRKVDIYAKILLQSNDSSKKKRSNIDKLSTEELLKLVDINEPTKVN